jgi:hypothetical protein
MDPPIPVNDRCFFLELPRELRDMVYAEVCPSNNERVAVPQRGVPHREHRTASGVPFALAPLLEQKHCLALLEVSKQIRVEAAPLLLRSVAPLVQQADLDRSGKLDFSTSPFLWRMLGTITRLELEIFESLTEADVVISRLLPPSVEHLRLLFVDSERSQQGLRYLIERQDNFAWELQHKTHSKPFHSQLYLQQYLSAESAARRRHICTDLALRRQFLQRGEATGASYSNTSRLAHHCPDQILTVTIVAPYLRLETDFIHRTRRSEPLEVDQVMRPAPHNEHYVSRMLSKIHLRNRSGPEPRDLQGIDSMIARMFHSGNSIFETTMIGDRGFYEDIKWEEAWSPEKHVETIRKERAAAET